MTDQLPEALWESLQEEFDVRLSPECRLKTELYRKLLGKWQKRINLTSLQTPEEILRYHFFESFWAADQFLGSRKKLADIGSGAGFPGLAIAIYAPSARATLIESNRKKAVFLAEVIRDLELPAAVACLRAEDFDQWNRFEIATLRALRFTPAIQQHLIEAQLELLWFHGGEPPPARWVAIEKKRIPGSRHRFVSRLSAQSRNPRCFT